MDLDLPSRGQFAFTMLFHINYNSLRATPAMKRLQELKSP